MSAFKSVCAFAAGLGFGAAAVWLAVAGTAPKTGVRTRQRNPFVERRGFGRAIEADEDRRLIERIAEAEGELRSAKAGLDSAETNAAKRSGRPLSYDEWFALQREANPETYAKLTNGYVRSCSRWTAAYRTRAEILGAVDASALDPEAAAVHAAYCDALVRISDLRRDELARRCASPDFKTDNSPEWQRQMRDLQRQVNELESHERFLLLGEAGRLHGLNERDARELAETMHLIIETTSSSKVVLKPQREAAGRSF